MLHLIVATDAKGLLQNATLLMSITSRTNAKIYARIFSRELEARDVTLGRLRVEVIVTPMNLRMEGRVPPHVAAGPTFDRIAALAYCTDWDRALIMDYDQVAVGDLAELFSMDLTGAIGAARFWHESLGSAARHWFGRELPVRWKECEAYQHIYMGPLVNLEEFRRDRVHERFVEFHLEANMEEQIALTVACRDRWLPLHASYNLVPAWDGVPADAKVLHFTGGGKPWHYPAMVGAHLWRHYETDWATLTGGKWCPEPVVPAGATIPARGGYVWERWQGAVNFLQIGGRVFSPVALPLIDWLAQNNGKGTWLIRALADESATDEMGARAAEVLAETGVASRCRVMDGDVKEMLAWLNTEDGSWETFDFILMHPPFRESETLSELCAAWTLLKPGGWLAVEPSVFSVRDAASPGSWKAIQTWQSAFADELQAHEDETTVVWFQKTGTGAASRRTLSASAPLHLQTPP
jgi:hypothetical protein